MHKRKETQYRHIHSSSELQRSYSNGYNSFDTAKIVTWVFYLLFLNAYGSGDTFVDISCDVAQWNEKYDLYISKDLRLLIRNIVTSFIVSLTGSPYIRHYCLWSGNVACGPRQYYSDMILQGSGWKYETSG